MLTTTQRHQVSGELLLQGLSALAPIDKLPARTLATLVIDHCVYDIVRNVVVYWGDYQSCAELEFSSDRYLMTLL